MKCRCCQQDMDAQPQECRTALPDGGYQRTWQIQITCRTPGCPLRWHTFTEDGYATKDLATYGWVEKVGV